MLGAGAGLVGGVLVGEMLESHERAEYREPVIVNNETVVENNTYVEENNTYVEENNDYVQENNNYVEEINDGPQGPDEEDRNSSDNW